MRRPAEQLYLTARDPYEQTDLAEELDHAQIKTRLSAALDEWMHWQADPGADLDTVKALQTARRGEHLYGPEATDPPDRDAARERQ